MTLNSEHELCNFYKFNQYDQLQINSYCKYIDGHSFRTLKLHSGNIYCVTTKEQLYMMCVELQRDTALDDWCDESGFKVDYPFTGLGYALKYTQSILFNFGTGIL